ncbi:MAG: gamma-glutamyltransferase [Proteobacteria bacterium]|nr:gamma-glutamyltransferase [Pseudomonadota bacterium]
MRSSRRRRVRLLWVLLASVPLAGVLAQTPEAPPGSSASGPVATPTDAPVSTPADGSAAPAPARAPESSAAEPAVRPVQRRARHAGKAWIAAANPMAVEAGLEILARGGNAVDAAVAVQAMLGLVEPQSSGLGGGAFLTYFDARSGKVSALDGRETAPAGARPDMFLDEHGRPLPYVEAVRSGRSTGVPGIVSLLSMAHDKLGRLHWKDLFQGVIRTATQGFPVPQRLAMFLGEGSPFPPTNEVRTLFSRPDGTPVNEGDLFRNPEYARTLQRIAQHGPRAFYSGPLAQAIVQATHHDPLPGTLTLKDLASYHAQWSDALCRPYRGYQVCVPPPPSGGVSLLQVLQILDRTDIASRGPADPRAWFLFAQASRLAYADRDRYIADPRFVRVPVDRLLDPAYIRQRAQLIGERAGPTPAPGVVDVRRGRDATTEAAGTSHCVIMDADGNVVSMTTTVESVFGSGRTVGGFVLNNQLTDFSFVATDGGEPVANAVRGGKRPRSSMAPVIVLDRSGNFVAALGSPGGSAITEYNAKALVGLLAWKLPVKQAIELPNLIARGEYYSGELSKFVPAVVNGLRERGMELKLGRAENSGLHAIACRPDGTCEGAADSRREGVARMLAPKAPARRHAA